MNLLVVEDEIKTGLALKMGLEEKGYRVHLANDGATALELAMNHPFDLILLDIIIPKVSGLDICKKLREGNNTTPIIMVSALGLTSDKVKGLDFGADDYIVKPFDFEELEARVRVAINRTRTKAASNNQLRFSDLSLDLDSKEASRNGTILNLTAKEYALLEFFMRNTNRVIAKEEIAEKVWDVNFDTGTNIIEVYVSYLRNKVDKGFKTKLIHTRKGLGYILKE